MRRPILKITPMGGVGEIGSNMTVFELDDQILIVDYGILFPYEDFFDINYLIVDLAQINQDKDITLFFTHAHEDHIGAVSHIVSEIPKAKIWAPDFAACLIRKKLEQRKLQPHINIYDESSEIKIGDFTVHPLHVTHSIPQTHGVIVEGKGTSTLFISDFKFDLDPVFEKPFNTQKMQKHFNNAEKRICLLDSTNILNPGKTISETQLRPSFEKIFNRNQRTFVTMFSSNIYRLKMILEEAKKQGRKVTSIGRSIRSYLEAAEESSLIDLGETSYVDFDAVSNYNDPRLIVLLTGCQGDHLGALRRVSSGDQRHINLNEDDIVLFSSKPIPGNEKKISRIMNDISLRGSEIIDNKSMLVHASGHPGQEDLKELLTYINPTDYIPIHGESFFLKKHHEFIQENYRFTSHLMANFNRLVVYQDLTTQIFDLTPLEPKLIHGRDLVIERERISERRKIACNGVIFITLNRKEKDLVLSSKGLPNMVIPYFDTFKPILINCAFNENKNKSPDDMAEAVRIKARNTYHNILGYKPITIVHSI